MIRRIYNHLYRATGEGLQSESETGDYIIMLVATLFSLVLHVWLLGVYAIFRIWPLALLNVCSVTIYLISLLCVKKQKYLFSGLISSIEIPIHAIATVYIAGAQPLMVVFILVALILQFILPYGTTGIRVVMGLFQWVALIAYIIIECYHVPLIVLSTFHARFLMIGNINQAFLACGLEFSLEGIVRHILADFNNLKMEQLEGQAHTDDLTGLHNRRYAQSFFVSVKPEEAWCVAVLDIDDFKHVNDTYGHAVGDVVLQDLAQTITSSLRSSDIVVRWGGEEFLFLMRDVTLPVAVSVLDQLRQTIAGKPIALDKFSLNITVTIGVASVNGTDVNDAISRSDIKLYEGKAGGKNTCIG